MSAASSFLERTLGQVDAIARQQRAVDVDTAREEHEAAQLRSTLAELSAASVSARAQLQAERGRLNASIGRTMRAKASVERARAALRATSASNAALVREIVALRDERDRAQQRFVRAALAAADRIDDSIEVDASTFAATLELLVEGAVLKAEELSEARAKAAALLDDADAPPPPLRESAEAESTRMSLSIGALMQKDALKLLQIDALKEDIDVAVREARDVASAVQRNARILHRHRATAQQLGEQNPWQGQRHRRAPPQTQPQLAPSERAGLTFTTAAECFEYWDG